MIPQGKALARKKGTKDGLLITEAHDFSGNMVSANWQKCDLYTVQFFSALLKEKTIAGSKKISHKLPGEPRIIQESALQDLSGMPVPLCRYASKPDSE